MQHLPKIQTNKLSAAARDQADPVAACKLERVDAPAATPCRRTRRKSPSKGRSPRRGRCRRGSRTANCRCSSSTQAPPFPSNDSLCELSPEPQSNVKKPLTETSRRSGSTTASPCTSTYPNQKTWPTFHVTKTDVPSPAMTSVSVLSTRQPRPCAAAHVEWLPPRAAARAAVRHDKVHNLKRVDAPAAPPRRRTRRKTPSKGCSPSQSRPRHGPQTATCRRSSSTLAPPFTSKNSLRSCSPSGG